MSGLGKTGTLSKVFGEEVLWNKGLSMQCRTRLTRNLMESMETPALISAKGSWDHHAGITEEEKLRETQDRSGSALVGEFL